MKIKVTGIKETERFLIAERDRIIKEFLEEINALALKVVTAVRNGEVSSWDDHTERLRSSVGYVLMMDGVKRHENFQTVGDGGEGTATGREFAYEIAARYPSKGIVLVIVAGMEYASYVEAIEGKNVLAGGELLTMDLLRDLTARWNR